ncbi:gephyrin-like molybdotransferase Glp [Falsibacillus pallidus]|uniref:Molybdopterin molybdenumtransferase n=1 Tax=Falsibacillus pallidus TaxID=493781 RepID=A0A370GCF9_9BACI|nr:molybdopterin molybdochelatase [Falsibacillus pallidus]
MVEKRTPIAVSEAVKRVMKYAAAGEKETVEIENACGRYLAEPLMADHDVPAFDRSPYDGFALRAEDTDGLSSSNPGRFEVIGQIGAGSVFNGTVGPNQAVRIMTGAQIPEGCNAVIMLELTKEIGSSIEIKRSLIKGENISFKGEDTQKGTVLAERGTLINAGIVALLATFGYKNVPVARKPVVGVLATGSELLDIDEPMQPGKIRNSNTYMLLGQIERAGGKPIYLGKLDDNLEECYKAVAEAMEKVDILITTGGVSVGDYDYLPAIYEKLGAEVLFNKIGMRPGSVTTVAQSNGKLLFGLSGNPSACYVGFELFVRPVLRTNLFNTRPHLRKARARLALDFSKANPFTRFVRGTLQYDEAGTLSAAPSGFDKSSAVSSLASADVLIVLPGGTRGYQEGMLVDILLLEDQNGSEWPWENIVASYK